ncbi:MAG: ShlB/FhaC/HecB family hemolysin secretion/activation protein [Hyphomicrobiales bacterium]|nr:MAG: ShlB/FhaC/HecB family hemolysin secretion/activation protein [Hyphomicrobiales bacterium]
MFARLGVACFASALVVLTGEAALAQGTTRKAKEKQPAASSKENAPTSEQQSTPAPPVQLFDIDEFRVDGAASLPQREVEAAIYGFLGPQKSSEDVEKARAALEKAYHDKGFQTVSVSVPAQNVQNGIVVLTVTEGKIGDLRVKNSQYYDLERIKESAPSLKPGTLPNFNAVTSDIMELNQWPDRRVTPVLRAGSKPGTVDVDLNVEDKPPLHASIELNNRQSTNTQPLRLTSTVRYDNLWQLGHSLNFSYMVGPERPDEVRVMNGSYLARLTPWTSLLVYGVDSHSNVASVGGMNIIGPGQVLGTRLLLTLPARENYFHSLSMGVDYKNFGQTVASGTSSFSSPIAYLPVTASYSATLQGEKVLTQANAGATFNVRGIGSGFDEYWNKRAYADANFFHANADIQHTRDLEHGFQVYGKLAGQLSDGPLVSSEQFSVGGADTVRGYLETVTIGDMGLTGTLEVRSPNIAERLPAEIKRDGDTKARKVFNEWRFFGFVDGGLAAIHKPLPEQKSNFYLWSYGAGTRFKLLEQLDGAVTVAVPMLDQGSSQANAPRVLFSLSGSF